MWTRRVRLLAYAMKATIASCGYDGSACLSCLSCIRLENTISATRLARARCIQRGRRLLEDAPEARRIVHVPPQEPQKLARNDFDGEQVRMTIDFAHAVGAGAIVVHRYLGLRRLGDLMPASREGAAERFLDALESALADSGSLIVDIENLGFFRMQTQAPSLVPRERPGTRLAAFAFGFHLPRKRHAAAVTGQVIQVDNGGCSSQNSLRVFGVNTGSFSGADNPSHMSPVSFPSAGCWRLRGRVGDVSLTYVVNVVVR